MSDLNEVGRNSAQSGSGEWLRMAAAVAVYVGGLAVIGSLLAAGGTGPGPTETVVLLLFAGAWSFLLGVSVGRFEALAGPALAVIAFAVTQAPTPDDYSWTDTGPVVLVFFLAYAAGLLVALGACVSAGVRVARSARTGIPRRAEDR